MVMYRNPTTRYQRFVNQYCLQYPLKAKSKICKDAESLWQKLYKNDDKALDEYLKRTFVTQKKIDTFFGKSVKGANDCGPGSREIGEKGSQTTESGYSHDSQKSQSAKISDNIENIPNTSGMRFDKGGKPKLVNESMMAIIQSFLCDIGVDQKRVLTQDVTSFTHFMHSLYNLSSTYMLYNETYSDYCTLHPTRKQNTKLLQNKTAIEGLLAKASSTLNKLADQQVQLSMGKIMQSVLEKAQTIQEMMTLVDNIRSKVDDQLRRLRVQISQKSEKCEPLSWSKFHIKGQNDRSLTWEVAMENLVLSEIETFPGLTCLELLKCAAIIQDTDSVSVTDLLESIGHKVPSYALKLCASKSLMEWLPVLILRKGVTFVAVNIHEAIVNPDFFEQILNVDIDCQAASSSPEESNAQTTAAPQNHEANTQNTPEPQNVRNSKPGRKARHIQFPGIVDKALNCLKLHGIAANSRRRNDTSSSMGTSIPELRQYLLKHVPGLKEVGISNSTVRRLLVAPHANHSASRYYKGLVDAKIAPKRNDLVEHEHEDLHFERSQLSYIAEASSRYEKDVIMVSVDDKNKINVGILAVSRYHQISRFFMADDQPQYSDHDFPYPNSKIIPSGYLILKNPENCKKVRCRSRSLNRSTRVRKTSLRSQSAPPGVKLDNSVCEDSQPHYIHDKLGRLHIKYSRTGPLYVVNRATPFHSSNAESHANDLTFILQDPNVRGNKNAVAIIADGGPDWSVKSLFTFIYMGRLWRDLHLDYLALLNFAPGHSVENPIEHKWSPLSKWLASVTLPIVLEGESVPPMRQTELTEAERTNKLAKVFDNAIETLCSYWNKTHDGHPVIPIPYPCFKQGIPYNDHDLVAKLLKSGINAARADPQLEAIRQEWILFAKHCVRRTYLVEFIRCESVNCSTCTPLRPQTPFMEYIREVGQLPTPVPSKAHPGHYCTWLHTTWIKPLPGIMIFNT